MGLSYSNPPADKSPMTDDVRIPRMSTSHDASKQRLASDEKLVEASIPALILLAAGLLPVLLLTRTGKR